MGTTFGVFICDCGFETQLKTIIDFSMAWFRIGQIVKGYEGIYEDREYYLIEELCPDGEYKGNPVSRIIIQDHKLLRIEHEDCPNGK